MVSIFQFTIWKYGNSGSLLRTHSHRLNKIHCVWGHSRPFVFQCPVLSTVPGTEDVLQ